MSFVLKHLFRIEDIGNARILIMPDGLFQRYMIQSNIAPPSFSNKGIGDAGKTANIRRLWSAMVFLGLL